jgi:hypothetical protein
MDWRRFLGMAGEELHEAGAEGVRRAKIWLDRTTRAEARWSVPDRVAVPKLTFPWARPDAIPFSFDIGGLLRGGDLEGQQFVAESKFYSGPGNQPTMYREFLAKCYCALAARPEVCDHFFWITWAPFLSESWKDLCTYDFVEKAVLMHSVKALNEVDADVAKTAVKTDLVSAVADRLWIIVLSKRQEQELIMSREHLALIRQHEIEMGA